MLMRVSASKNLKVVMVTSKRMCFIHAMHRKSPIRNSMLSTVPALTPDEETRAKSDF